MQYLRSQQRTHEYIKLITLDFIYAGVVAFIVTFNYFSRGD